MPNVPTEQAGVSKLITENSAYISVRKGNDCQDLRPCFSHTHTHKKYSFV